MQNNLLNFFVRAVVGKYEGAECLNKSSLQSETSFCDVDESSKRALKGKHYVNKEVVKNNSSIFMKSLETYKAIIEWLKTRGKHICCPHPHSCVHYTLTVCIRIDEHRTKV